MLAVILLVVILVIQFGLTLMVLIESIRSKRHELRLFAIVSFSTILWTVCNIVLVFVDSYGNDSNLVYFDGVNRLAFFLACFTLLSIYYFSFFYPLKKQIGVRHRVLIIVTMIVTMFAPFTAIAGSFLIKNQTPIYVPGELSIIIGVVALLIIANGINDDVRILRSTNDRQLRRQATTLLAGLTLTIIHAIIFLVVFPLLYGQNPAAYAIGYIAPIYFVSFTVYGLLRQGLFDIRLFVARSAAYVLAIGTILLTTFVLIFVLLGYMSELGVERFIIQILTSLIVLILAILYQPVKNFFDRLTNGIFYRDAYNAQELLNELNSALVSSIDLHDIQKKTTEVLRAHIRPSQVAMLVYIPQTKRYRIFRSEGGFIQEPERAVKLISRTNKKSLSIGNVEENERNNKTYMIKNDIGLVSKIESSKKESDTLGYLFLAPKMSGNLYNKDDHRIIEIISDELVIAVQNALRFEEIQEFARTLEDKVEAATRDLRKANEKLKQLDETKDDFISMASHQLRTPLTSVKGYVSMVLDGDVGKVSKKQQELLNQAYVSSQRMVYLIADLLNVSRLKTGKFIIEAKETNLADVIEGEISQLTETAKAKDLKVTYDKPKKFPTLMLDETKIRQVIMNFADNAIYYTPSGGHIKIVLEDKGQTVEFRVEDDGIGVPKAEQHHLFNKFYRAGNARKARPDGTGLGLFMAKKVVVAQGGAIIFKSTENKGSTFGFSFEKKKLLPQNYKGTVAKESVVEKPKVTSK